jgi:hypothetical protein
VILTLQATLSAPPSSVHCFRDVTLYANVFCNLEVIISCECDSKDLYWKWLKRHGAMDFIKDIVPKEHAVGYIIGDDQPANFTIPKLDEFYIRPTIGKLNELQTV